MKLPNELILRFEGVLLDKLNELTHESTREEVSPGIFIESEIGYIPFLVDIYSYPLSKSRRYIAREHFGYYSLTVLDEEPIPPLELSSYIPLLNSNKPPIMCCSDYINSHFILGVLIHLKSNELFEGEYIRTVIETSIPNHLITNPITILTDELVYIPEGTFIPSEFLCV